MEFYHLLNRGVDKRNIFLSKNDYWRFVHSLFVFNDVKNVDSNNSRYSYSQKLLDIGCPVIGGQCKEERELLVHIHFFCLMPNHYHLLVSPLVENGISLFMKKVNMGYAKYFNEKYDRSGALFQGRYRSQHIVKDAHFLWIPYYIHFNPLDMYMPEWRDRNVKNSKKALEYLESYKWSSHQDYLGKKNVPSVTQRDFFLESFGGEKGYTKSIKEQLKAFDTSCVAGLVLE